MINYKVELFLIVMFHCSILNEKITSILIILIMHLDNTNHDVSGLREISLGKLIE